MARLKIREIAEAQGITAARLARRADLAYGTVKALWDDPDRDAALSTLEKIADALGVQVIDLIQNGPKSGPEAESGNSLPVMRAAA